MKLIHLNQFKMTLYLVNRECLRLLLFIFSGMFFSVLAQPQMIPGSHSHEKIQQTAKKFLEEKLLSADNPNIEVSIGRIDPRLKLVKCDGNTEAFLPQGSRQSGRTTVGVRCHGTVTWKLFIPANIQNFETVWVANRHLNNTDVIGVSDIKKQRIQIDNIRKSPLMNLQLILNTSPKRQIRAGGIIFKDSVCLVCRGDKVTISAQNQYLSVLVEGVALTDAAIGETAQIRNSKSKRTFGAIVTGKNQLKVQLSGTH